jgi:hypothetical protein
MRVEVPVLQVELVGGSSGNASEYAKCRNALQAAVHEGVESSTIVDQVKAAVPK